jgi:hypothetical protein
MKRKDKIEQGDEVQYKAEKKWHDGVVVLQVELENLDYSIVDSVGLGGFYRILPTPDLRKKKASIWQRLKKRGIEHESKIKANKRAARINEGPGRKHQIQHAHDKTE